MAEALGAVGAAASFVQLTDVSIRTCLYLYTFLSSVNKAQNEFQRHMIVLRDVHDAIQLIRRTTASHSLQPIEEGMLKKHLRGIIYELSHLQKITAGKDPAKLSVRLKWVLKSAETDRGLQELEHRKTSLILLLQAITMRDSAQCRGHQDSNQALLQSLVSHVEQQSVQDSSAISGIYTYLDRIRAQMDSNVAMYKESLKEGFSTLTRDREVKFTEERMEQVLRSALDSYILPRVEESFSKTSELQNAATIRLIQEAMGQATEQILGRVADMAERDHSVGPRPSFISSPEKSMPARSLGAETEFLTRSCVTFPEGKEVNSRITQRGLSRHPKRKEWSHWTTVSAVGTFLIRYGSQMGDSGQFWTMQIDFWPSITFLSSKCISLKYGNNYDPHGYMALFPSLAVYPIISNDHPIWKMIEGGDMGSIRMQFQDHNVGPYDQDSHGITLLTSSFRVGRLEVAQFLLMQGADPTRTTVCNRDGLHDLIYYTMNNLIQPLTMCLACHLRYWMDFSLFCSLFHDLLASGCDLDACDVNIYHCLEEGRFADLELNQADIADPEYLRFRERYIGPMKEKEGRLSNITYEERLAQVSADSNKMSLSNKDSYLARIRRMAEFLRRQGLDLTKESGSSRVPELLRGAKRMTLPVLLECGLDGDYRDPSRDHMASILYHGLYCFQDSDSDFNMDNLVNMIGHGADIFDMEWADDDWLGKVADDGVMTPTAYAKATGCARLWRYALNKAGYDPDQVFLEDERRRREFRRLHGATSSAVEMEGPPRSELRRRLA